MTFYESSLTFLILFVLTVIAYCKYANKTLGELVKEIKEIFSDSSEEIQEGGLPQ